MSKIHFCKNFVDFVECSETDPSKFESGRYSICKKCRSLQSGKQKCKLREHEKEEKIKEQIKDIIKNDDLIEDKTIVDFVIDSRKIVSDVAQNSHVYKIKKEQINTNFNIHDEKINSLTDQINSLVEINKNYEKRIKFLENDIEKFKEMFNTKENIYKEEVTILKYS